MLALSAPIAIGFGVLLLFILAMVVMSTFALIRDIKGLAHRAREAGEKLREAGDELEAAGKAAREKAESIEDARRAVRGRPRRR